jgi:DNA mismatch endonuclease (patch repair protein)
MVDIVSKEVRSRMMSSIRATNTKPEVMLRKGLHSRGIRFRLHDRKLPGKPDLVFPKYNAILLVNGCFWHGHDCHLFKWPSTRDSFWKTKINRNKEVDLRTLDRLQNDGWRTGIVWECAIKGRTKLKSETVISICEKWLRGRSRSFELTGHNE